MIGLARPVGELLVTTLAGLVIGTASVGILGSSSAVIALLGVIATVDMAQFALVLDHRERLVGVETRLATDGGEPRGE